MKITYLGQELDATIEHELISKNEFGFKVDIIYNKDSWYPHKEDTVNNCTEVHHLFSKDYISGHFIAFESDIHSTGFTRRIETIESVNIVDAEKIYDSFQ